MSALRTLAARSDEQLAAAAAASCDRSFAELARRLRPLLRTVRRGFYAPGLDDQDLEQETLIALHAAVVSWRPGRGAPLRTVIAGVVRRRLYGTVRQATAGKHGPLDQSLRWHAPPPGVHDDIALESVVADPRSDPHRALVAKDAVRDAIARIDGLSPLARYDELGPRKQIDNAAQRARRKLAA